MLTVLGVEMKNGARLSAAQVQKKLRCEHEVLDDLVR